MINYEIMRKQLGDALRESDRQKRKAAELMDRVAAYCESKLGIPRKNIHFFNCVKGEREHPFPSAGFVIDRDEEGTWKSAMEIRIDPDYQGTYATTIVYFDVIFDPARQQFEICLAGDSDSIGVTDGPAGNDSFTSLVDKVANKIGDTAAWIRGGGAKPQPIGFGGLHRKD